MKEMKRESCIAHSNRGVGDTGESGSKGLYIRGLDWFEFTVWDFSVSAIIERILKLFVAQFQKAIGSYHGYCTKYTLGVDSKITIWADGGAQQGVHVILTAKGCDYLQTVLPLQELFAALSSICMKITRLDLALDDTSGQWYTVQQLIAHARNSEILSCWRSFDVNLGYSFANGSMDKAVIYLGSAHSDFYLRVYDKTLEQAAHGVDLAALPKTWTRWEFCCRNQKAETAVSHLQQEVSLHQVFADLLSQSMRITQADQQQSNRSRWRVRPKWLRFVVAVAQNNAASA